MYWLYISLGVFGISIIILTIIAILFYKYSKSNNKTERIETICAFGIIPSLAFVIIIIIIVSINTICFKEFLSKKYNSSRLEKKQELLFKIKEQKEAFKENAYVYYKNDLDEYNSGLENYKKDNSLWVIWKKVSNEQYNQICERIDFYKISQTEIDNL